MLYEASFTIKETINEKELKIFSNQIDNETTDKQNFNSNFPDVYYIKEDENVYCISQKKNVQKYCSLCNVGLIFKPEIESSLILENHKIDIKTTCFFTSEYIKINSFRSGIKNIHRNDAFPLLCTIKSKDKDVYKFRVIDCPSIKFSQIFWECTAGYFPCDNYGDSVIYCSPQESESSKSPVTLSLYEKDIFNGNSKNSFLVDQKKIWLL